MKTQQNQILAALMLASESFAMPVIKVHVEGGVVQDVEDVPPGVGVVVIDQDNIEAGDPAPAENEIHYGGEPAPRAYSAEEVAKLLKQTEDKAAAVLAAAEAALAYLNKNLPKGNVRKIYHELVDHACVCKALHFAITEGRTA